VDPLAPAGLLGEVEQADSDTASSAAAPATQPI
jgi:hypothetical protein